jgi:hypothetical protein
MAEIPSICLIPSGYKATKIYSVLPVDGSADLTFDRGTSDDQTRVNSNGLIEDVDQDVPRLDYSDGGCPSLLLEPATTNLITHSEEFDNAAWIKLNASITANQAISPKGDLTADRLIDDNSGGSGTVRLDFSAVGLSSSQKYTLSFFAKSDSLNEVLLNANNYDGSTDGYAFFSLSGNGSINGSTNIDNSTIESYGNGWYRCSISITLGSANTSLGFQIFATENQNSSVPLNGSSSVYVWGAQLEEQSYATSYVPSLGTNGVRSAETSSKTGLSSYINSTEGVLYAELSALFPSGYDGYISISDGTSNNRVTIRNTSASNNVVGQCVVGGVNQASMDFTLIDRTINNKVAIKWKENDFALWVNGLEALTDLSGSVPSSLSELSFDNGSGVANWYGKTKDLRVYNEALSDLELARLTGFTSFLEMRNYLNYTAE